MTDSERILYLLKEQVGTAYDQISADLRRRRVRATGKYHRLLGAETGDTYFVELEPLSAIKDTIEALLSEKAPT